MGQLSHPLAWVARVLGASTVVAALVACAGLLEPRDHADDACQCTLTAPVMWQRAELLDEPHLGLSFGERYVVARWLPRTAERLVNSATTVLDNEVLADAVPTGTDLPALETIDGRPAAVRELQSWGDDTPVDMYVAVVDYDDGFLQLMAWTLAGDTAAYDEVVALARTTTHDPGDDEAPVAVPLHPEPHTVAREALEGQVDRAAPSSPEEPPDGLEAIRYRSEGRELVAWQTLVGDTPGPGVLLLHDGFEPLSQQLLGPLAPLTDAGLRVVAPEVRGDRGGPHELFGGEVDDALAALSHLRARPDVDPDRIVVWGEGSGGVLAQWIALSAEVQAVVAVDAPTDLTTTRERFEHLYGTDAYPADETQDGLRSPARFATQLRTPLHLWNGEFGSFPEQGRAMKQAATGEQPVHLWIVPRETDTYWTLLRTRSLTAWARGEPIGSHALAHEIGAERWQERREPLLAEYRRMATQLHATGVLSDDDLTATVVRWRGASDGRPAVETVKDVLAKPPPPHPQATPLRKALQELRSAGLWVGIGLDEQAFDQTLREVFAGRGRPTGFLVVTDRELLDALDPDQRAWALSYGDVYGDSTEEGTRRVGERVMAALQRAGLEPRWSGSADDAIVIPWE